VLIRDVRIFDGRGDGLADGMSVFVQGKRIERIGRTCRHRPARWWSMAVGEC
jgi:hypothetical protein